MSLKRQTFIKVLATKIVLAFLLANSPVNAGDEEKRHQYDAHVHGEAVLNIVLEGKSVEVELQTPAANILGFEHKPRTGEQRSALERATKLLQKHTHVFQFNAGGCQQTSLDLEAPFTDHSEEYQEDKHDHDHDHHHHEHESDSEHKESKHHDEHDGHSEFHVVYKLNCNKLKDVSAVEVTVFKHFSGFETVRVQWVGTNGQGLGKASRAKTEVTFNP